MKDLKHQKINYSISLLTVVGALDRVDFSDVPLSIFFEDMMLCEVCVRKILHDMYNL